MISDELKSKIRRLYHAEQWPVGTIARELGLHHGTVRRALLGDGVGVIEDEGPPSTADAAADMGAQ